jgi:hypothetical protein
MFLSFFFFGIILSSVSRVCLMMSLSTPCKSLADHAKTFVFVQELHKLFFFFGAKMSPYCDCSVGHII